jgi:hypothetical protein
MTENQEMYFEGGQVDEDRKDDEACYARTPMPRLISLR